jgi:hypothetical protein
MPATRSRGTKGAGAGFSVVEESVAGCGIFLDVMDYSGVVQCCVDPVGHATQRRVAAAVAGHDRRWPGEFDVSPRLSGRVFEAGAVISGAEVDAYAWLDESAAGAATPS